MAGKGGVSRERRRLASERPARESGRMIDKALLFQAVITELEEELRMQSEAALMARDEATDEESRAEDKYDMRSQSAAYLAAGQARLATEIGEAIGAFRTLPTRSFAEGEVIATGAVVTLEARGRRSVYLLGPQRGGLEVTVNGVGVTVVTPHSPLGRQLVGRTVGQEVNLPGRARPGGDPIAAVE